MRTRPRAAQQTYPEERRWRENIRSLSHGVILDWIARESKQHSRPPSARELISSSQAVCRSPEITKLQLLGVRRTNQESRKQILNSWKILITGIKFYWLVAGHDALVHAMLLRRNRFNDINAASVRCADLLCRTKLDYTILNLSIRRPIGQR